MSGMPRNGPAGADCGARISMRNRCLAAAVCITSLLVGLRALPLFLSRPRRLRGARDDDDNEEEEERDDGGRKMGRGLHDKAPRDLKCAPRGYRHNSCCHRDFASRVSHIMPYTDWSPQAFWRTTCISTADYFASNPNYVSVLTQMPGWILSRTRADDMHCTKLGVCHYVIANTLVYLMMKRAYIRVGKARDATLPDDATKQEILDDLFVRFHEWLKHHNINCSAKRFTVKRVHRDTESSYPAFLCKASEAVPLTSWLADLTLQFSEACDPSEREHALVVAHMLHGLCSYFCTLKEAGRFLTPAERTQVYRSGHKFLYMYSELRWRSEQENTYLWGLYPKFHQYHHLVLDAYHDGCNPRYFHCFGDEDQVGRMIALARASHPSKVVFNTITLYWIGLVRRLKSFS